MIGLTAAVYSCIQLSLCLAGPIIWGWAFKFICSAENYVNVFYSTFTNVFYFCHVFTFLTFFFILRERFFLLSPNRPILCGVGRKTLTESTESVLRSRDAPCCRPGDIVRAPWTYYVFWYMRDVANPARRDISRPFSPWSYSSRKCCMPISLPLLLAYHARVSRPLIAFIGSRYI